MAGNNVFIVVKKCPIKGMNGLYCSFNEAVFTSEKLAGEYIDLRKAAKDRDDRGCSFEIEPWFAQDTLSPERR